MFLCYPSSPSWTSKPLPESWTQGTGRHSSLLFAALTVRSRIPVYGESRDNILGLLYVKVRPNFDRSVLTFSLQDLAFIDPDDKTPLESVIKYYNHKIEVVDASTKLDKMLDLFKLGRTHMVLVTNVNSEVSQDARFDVF